MPAKARHEMYGDTPPFISEGIFSDIAVEGTTDKTGVHMDMPARCCRMKISTMGSTKLGRYWTEAYNRIKYANVVIPGSMLLNGKMKKQSGIIFWEKHTSTGLMFITGWFNQYGDVPLVLEEIIDPSLIFIHAPVKVFYGNVKKILNLQLNGLMKRPSW